MNQLLQVIEPAGYRWLNETYLKVDRGVEFYNHAAVPYVGLFWLNRLWLVVLGLGAVLLTRGRWPCSLRGVVPSRRGPPAAASRRSWSRQRMRVLPLP